MLDFNLLSDDDGDDDIFRVKDVSTKDIAVIGISLKQSTATNTDEFWDFLQKGEDKIRPFPSGRKKDTDAFLKFKNMWSHDLRYDRWAFLEEIDKFDYSFFKLSPKEASLMDPNQRMFLEVAWEAIEDAGYGGDKLYGSKTGVFVGFSNSHNNTYQNFIVDVEPESYSLAYPGNLPSILPSRISYQLDLRGPSMIVDTACSSTLVAIHLATQSLRNGECEQAIVGGVKLHLLPLENKLKIGIESTDGRTWAFDENSDGAGAGEGVAAVLLKPLSKAKRDGDQIYAVIKGSAINQDGRSIGITAPRPEAQEEVLISAWEDAGIDPETISYIETHGTGTKLGDPIEIEGLTRAFRRYTNRKQFCAISAVKTNIGHLDTSAGIFGFIKAVLSLHNKTIPATINFKRPNRKIKFHKSPIYINDTSMPWETDGAPRRCGVSAFALSGTNCHIVLEEAEAEAVVTTPEAPQLLTLSARSREALQELVKRYSKWLARRKSLPLVSLCYTAATGRGHYQHRLALLIQDQQDLVNKIEQLQVSGLSNLDDPTILYAEHKVVSADKDTNAPDEYTEAVVAERTQRAALLTAASVRNVEVLQELASLYVQGATVDWAEFYRLHEEKKISLPVYPFERKRCWLDVPVVAGASGSLYHVTHWRPQPLVVTTARQTGTVLLLDEKSNFTDELVSLYQASGRRVVRVTLGDAFAKQGENSYVIAGQESDYLHLFENLKATDLSQIVHLFTLQQPAKIRDVAHLNEQQTRGVFSLYSIVKAYKQVGLEQALDVVLISEKVSEVNGTETTIHAEHAPLHGLGKIVGMENFSLPCRSLDIDSQVSPQDVFAELQAGFQDYKVAYRGAERFIEELQPYDLERAPSDPISYHADGVYVITGGTGGIGQVLIQHLTREQPLNLALIGRSALPARSEWEVILADGSDKSLCQKLHAIKAAEQKGASIAYYQTDLSDATQLATVLSELRVTYGKIRGVIHSAGLGVGRVGKPLVESSLEELCLELAPKVQGSWLLDELTREDALDFFVVFSSPITLMGGAMGVGSYIAANAYQDAFVAYRNKMGRRTYSMSWAPWAHTVEKLGDHFEADRQMFLPISNEYALLCFDEIVGKVVPPVSIQVGEINYASKLFYLQDNLPFNLSTDLKAQVKSAWQQAAAPVKQEVTLSTVVLKGRANDEYSIVEQQLAQIWGSVLGFNEIDLFDNFFELGGDSIIATKIVHLVNEKMSAKIQIIDLLKNLTFHDLAQELETRNGREVENHDVTDRIPTVEKRDHYPVSSAQQRMFIVQQYEGATTSYNVPLAINLLGALDIARFEQAVCDLVKRHETLRTSFSLVDGEPVQQIHDHVDLDLFYKEVTEAEVDEHLHAFVQPFDLGQLPLFRVGLFKIHEERHVLMFDLHHIISDGVSLNVITREFVSLYEGETLPPLRIHYKDYTVWEQENLKSEAMREQEQYWLNSFAGNLPVLKMPLDFKRPEQQTFEGSTIYSTVPIETTRRLEELAKKQNVTLYTLMFAMYNVLLQQYSNQEDQVVGSIILGRQHADLQNIIGVFINYLAVRNQVRSTQTFEEFLQSANEQMMGAFANQEYPFDKIVEKLTAKIDRSRNPLFDTMLIFHNELETADGTESGGLRFRNYDFHDNTSKLDFKLDMSFGTAGELILALEYKVGLFTEATMTRFLAHFDRLIELLLVNQSLPLAELPLLTAEERAAFASKRVANDGEIPKMTLAVSSTFTSEPIENYVQWWYKQFGEQLDVRFASYNQVFRELLDSNSLLSTNTGINLLLVRFEDWIRDVQGTDEVMVQKLEQSFGELVEALTAKEKRVPYFVGVFPVSTHLCLPEAVVKRIEELTLRWKQVLESLPNVYAVDFTDLEELYLIEATFDSQKDKLGHIPFTDEFYAAMGTAIARHLQAWKKQHFKVIVLDCDNTLWKGVVGEDGPLDVAIEEGHLALQRLAIEKYNQGMLLAICSKNNEADVWEVFDSNPNMLLTKEHFVGWRINWQPKSQNVRELAKELNLGLDSFIFLDDSRTECSDMMSNCPEVLTLLLPEDAKQFTPFLKHVWAFDRLNVTEEDKNRTQMYLTERKRQESQQEELSLQDFLSNLQLKMSMRAVEPSQVLRASQMTQRTNQFNLSTIRRTEEEITALLTEPDIKTWVVEVSDRFGDYGLVGLLITKQEQQHLLLDTFLLSCRVLGRGVEDAILVGLKQHAETLGLEALVADFIPTKKNKPFLEFLERSAWEKYAETPERTTFHLPLPNIPDTIAHIECYFDAAYEKAVVEQASQANGYLLDHIGVATSDIDSALAHYQLLGYSCTAVVHDPLQNAYLAMCNKKGSDSIELVAPVNDASPAAAILKKNEGDLPYHLCYLVEDFATFRQSLEANEIKYDVISEEKPAILFDNKEVMFLYIKEVGLIELYQNAVKIERTKRKSEGKHSVARLIVAQQNRALPFYNFLGYKVEKNVFDSVGKRHVITLNHPHSGRLELITPAEPGTIEAKFLAQNGPHLFRVALEVAESAPQPQEQEMAQLDDAERFGSLAMTTLSRSELADYLLLYRKQVTAKTYKQHDWTVFKVNEGQLLHEMHLLPLAASSVQKLLELPVQEGTAKPVSRVPYEAPRDELEERIAAVWCRVLGLDRVGIHDSFIELGGHSLLAIKLEVELEKEHLIIDNFDFTKYNTIKSLSDLLRSHELTVS